MVRRFRNEGENLKRGIRQARRGEINGGWVDRFTLVHFCLGVVYAAAGLTWLTAALLALLWEISENPLKKRFPGIFPRATADTPVNSVSDVIALMLGWAAGQAVWPVV